MFTTHTPVPAGNDTYPPEQVKRALGRLAAELSIPIEELIALGPHAADGRMRSSASRRRRCG